VYGSVMEFTGATSHKIFHGSVDLNQSLFHGEGYNWSFYGVGNIFNDVYFQHGSLTINETPTTFVKVRHNCSQWGGISNSGSDDITVINPVLTNTLDSTYSWRTEGTGDLILINPSPLPTTATVMNGNADVSVYCSFYFNLHVKDKDGNNLGDVTCLLEDKDDNEAFSVDTAASGKIVEQTVDYKKWTGTDETLTEYTPHKLTLSKANYETLVIDNITMDEAKDLEFELLPALAVGDVRDGTSFGESKEGTLDHASEDDVRYLTKFDNETKTGKCVLPPENKTATGEAYGTDGGEFIGSYARQTVVGIAVGQGAEGMVEGD